MEQVICHCVFESHKCRKVITGKGLLRLKQEVKPSVESFYKFKITVMITLRLFSMKLLSYEKDAHGMARIPYTCYDDLFIVNLV